MSQHTDTAAPVQSAEAGFMEALDRANRGELPFIDVLQHAADMYSQKAYAGTEPSISHLLPMLLTLQGQPYTLQDHFPMEPLFGTTIPWKTVYRCGRQIGKSCSLAAQGLLQSAVTPYFRTLYILPLYEMARRLSNNYIKPFIDSSRVKSLMMDAGCENNVLQRTFANHAAMFFSYAFTDCSRVRGLSADKVGVDEAQEIDFDFLPIIGETMAASRNWGVWQYSGTPLTTDNTLDVLWGDSSQAEWVIRCTACNHWNIAGLEFDLLRMVGPLRNVREFGTGLVCAKCGRPVDSRKGKWFHKIPERRLQFAGYHVPQIILPMHYASEKKWAELLQKRDKVKNAVFLNECMGESCDVGLKLLTIEELKQASRLHVNDYHVARQLPFTRRYIQRIIGVDWGGGGEDEISYTTVSVVGLTPDGRYELIYTERMHIAVSDVEEVRRVLELCNMFQCQYLAHDYAGAGSVHETLLIQAGFPNARIIPFVYTQGSSKAMITYHAGEVGGRSYYSLDKARSLLLMCAMLKTQTLLLTEYESSKELTSDFLHLKKDTVSRPNTGERLLITRQEKQPDDVAQATNFACCGLYHTTQRYPNIAKSYDFRLTAAQQQMAAPYGAVMPSHDGSDIR